MEEAEGTPEEVRSGAEASRDPREEAPNGPTEMQPRASGHPVSQATSNGGPDGGSDGGLHARTEIETLREQLRVAKRQIAFQEQAVEAQRRRSEALEASRHRIGSVLRTARHAFLVVDVDGAIETVNPVFCETSKQLFGRVPQPGDEIMDFVRSQDVETFTERLRRARAGETIQVVKPMELASSTQWFRFVYAPVGAGHSVDGRSQHSVVIHIEDVTDVQEVQAELRDTTGRYRSLIRDVINTIASGLLIYDADLKLVWMNEAAKSFFGIRGDELRGREEHEIMQQRIAPVMRRPDGFLRNVRALASSKTWNATVSCRIRPGEGRPARVLEYRRTPIDRGTYAGGYVEHYYDITRLKAAEDDLRAAKQEADAAREGTHRFLSTVSHEVRTTLSGILGFAELLLENGLDGDNQHFVELIDRSGRSLLTLLSNVLDLARLEAGALTLDHRPFSPVTCARDALDVVRGVGTRKGLDVSMEISGPVPDVVCGDRLRIRQILINLLSNAVKYTDDGSVSLHVEAQPIDAEVRSPAPYITEDLPPDADLLLYFSVCDTGIGISKEEQAHLFDAFYQAGDDADRSHGGSGLGLNIVGKLVRALGGTLAIDSAPGAGSRFHVRLPVETATSEN